MNPLKSDMAVFALLVAFAATPALAADCADAMTQTDMTTCFNDNFVVADKTLNTLYQRLMKTLEPDDRKMLQDAQRAWISFRDKHCAFVANPNAGGTIYPSIVSACATQATAVRAGQLRDRLQCQEGDMGCGS